MRSQTSKRGNRLTSSREKADRQRLASSDPPANLLPKRAFRRPSKKKFAAMLIAGAVTLTIPSLILALVLLG